MSTRAALCQYHETILEMQEDKSPLSQWDFSARAKTWCSILSYVLDDENKNKGRGDARHHTLIQKYPRFYHSKEDNCFLKMEFLSSRKTARNVAACFGGTIFSCPSFDWILL